MAARWGGQGGRHDAEWGGGEEDEGSLDDDVQDVFGTDWVSSESDSSVSKRRSTAYDTFIDRMAAGGEVEKARKAREELEERKFFPTNDAIRSEGWSSLWNSFVSKHGGPAGVAEKVGRALMECVEAGGRNWGELYRQLPSVIQSHFCLSNEEYQVLVLAFWYLPLSLSLIHAHTLSLSDTHTLCEDRERSLPSQGGHVHGRRGLVWNSQPDSYER